MTRLALLASAAALSAAPAFALETPRPCSAADKRIRCIPYNPAQVVRLPAAIGGSLGVEFGPTERIEDVSVSDNGLLDPNAEGTPSPRFMLPAAAGAPQASVDRNLQVSRRGPFLFLKPLRGLVPQAVNVITVDADGKTRPYAFQLETREGGMTEEVDDTIFRVRFSYPLDEGAERRKRWEAQREAREARAAADRLRANNISGETPKNVEYHGQGTKADRDALAPSSGSREPSAWDDGQRTYLRYAGNRRIPMVYAMTVDGQEWLPGQSTERDPTTSGKLVIVHGVFSGLRLRDGKAVLCVANRGWDGGRGRNPGTGTTSPDVVRENVAPKESRDVR